MLTLTISQPLGIFTEFEAVLHPPQNWAKFTTRAMPSLVLPLIPVFSLLRMPIIGCREVAGEHEPCRVDGTAVLALLPAYDCMQR